MDTVGDASPKGSDVVMDDEYHATTRAILLRGSTFLKIGLSREVAHLSRQLEKKVTFLEKLTHPETAEDSLFGSAPEVEAVQELPPRVAPEVEAALQAQIKKASRQLEDVKLLSRTSLSAVRAVASMRGNNELAAQIAALLDDLLQNPGTDNAFDAAALGIIPGLPDLSGIDGTDGVNRGQPDPVSTKFTTAIAAVSKKSASDSAADTLFDDLYNEPDEEHSNHLVLPAVSNADVGYETEHYFNSDDDSVVEETDMSDSVVQDTIESDSDDSIEIICSPRVDDTFIPGLH